MKFRVVVSDAAWSHLDELYGYLAEKAGVSIAKSFVGKIHRFILKLSDFPGLGKRRNSTKVPDLHTAPHGNTVIAYTIDRTTATVTILGVYHGGRDYESDLEIDTTAE